MIPARFYAVILATSQHFLVVCPGDCRRLILRRPGVTGADYYFNVHKNQVRPRLFSSMRLLKPRKWPLTAFPLRACSVTLRANSNGAIPPESFLV
jgi:hypothetical protein